jgi:hypothetical protein
MKTATENLLNLLNLRPSGAVDVIRTIDGHFIGRAFGDPGYNLFIGKPSGRPGPGMDRTREVWETFSDSERAAVIDRADNPPDGEPIPLDQFGISYFPAGYGPKGKL